MKCFFCAKEVELKVRPWEVNGKILGEQTLYHCCKCPHVVESRLGRCWNCAGDLVKYTVPEPHPELGIRWGCTEIVRCSFCDEKLELGTAIDVHINYLPTYKYLSENDLLVKRIKLELEEVLGETDESAALFLAGSEVNLELLLHTIRELKWLRIKNE